MAIAGIDHINIDTDRLDETVQFYSQVLGFESRAKPSGNPGVWLYVDEQPLVHVNLVESVEELPATGHFNHIAFAATDAEALVAALDDAGATYRYVESPELGRTQIFTHDPNGIQVELHISH